MQGITADQKQDLQNGEDWNRMAKEFITFITSLDLEVSHDDGLKAMQMSRAISQQMRTWGIHPPNLDHTLIPLLQAAMNRYAS